MSVLEFFRQVEPRFDDVPDDKLIEFITREEPEFLKDKPFRNLARATFAQQATQSQFRNELEAELEQEANPFLSTGFGRAITRGAGQMLEGAAGAADAVSAVTRQLGLGDNPQFRLGSMLARSFAAGERELPAVGPRSLADAEGPADVGALILERGVGEQIPNLIATAATSGAGLFAGLAPKAASVLGALTTTFPLEMGGAFDEIKQLTGKEAPLTAAGVGAVNAFLETFGDSKLIERALGGDQLVGNTVSQLIRNLASRTAAQGAREAGVEAAQELTTALAPMLQGAAAPENLGERLGTAALLGGAGGGVFSAGTDIGGLASDAARSAIQNRRLERAFTDLDQTPQDVDIMRFDRANLPGGEAIPFERAGIPFERAGIPFERAGIPVERAGIPFQRQEIIPFDRPQLPGDEAIPVERQEIVPFERAGIPFQRQDIIPVGRATREQVAASELLNRLAADRQQAAAEATQLEEQGRNDLAILRFTDSLAKRIDALVALRQSPPLTPEATVGQAPGVVAPGAIPQEVPNAQTVRSDPGLIPPPGSPIEGGQVESRQDLPVQEPREITPATQAPQAVRRGSYIAARESGDRFVIQMTPQRIAAIEDMGAISEEETAEAMKADSRGIPTGSPQSNAGILMQQMLAASAVIESMSERSGVQLDAEAKAVMEKRYQEQALNQYVKAKEAGQPMQFSQREAYRAALKDASRLPNTAGQLRGRVSTIEMPDEPGMIRPDVEEAAQVEQEDDRAEATLNFLDQFTSKAEREAVMNLIADALGVARPIENPSRAAERYMADPRLKQLVDEFTKTTELRFSLGSLVGQPMTVDQVTQAAAGILPDLSQVQIIDDPGLITADGVPIRAQYRPGEAKPYLLNAAFLGSEQQVREALLEELVHGVWNDPEVQAEWDAVKQQLTEGDLQSVAQYPEAVRVEEAANRKVLEADNLGLFDQLLNAIASAIQRIFGIDLKLYPARRILDRALRARRDQVVRFNNPQETETDIVQYDFSSIFSDEEFGYATINLKKLDNEIANGRFPAKEVQSALFRHLYKLSDDRAPIRIAEAITNRASSEVGFQGQFSTSWNSNKAKIAVVMRDSNGRVISPQRFLRILNHELLHNTVTSKLQIIPSTLRQELDELFQFVLNNRDKYTGKNRNAFTNVSEFVSESLSSKDIRDWLITLKYDVSGGKSSDSRSWSSIKNTAFGGFLNIVRRILGLGESINTGQNEGSVDTITALDQVVSIVDRIGGYSRVSAQAMMGLMPSDSGPVRNSLARGVWKNAADAQKDAQAAGDPETILRSAAAQGTIVPPQYKAEVDALNVEGATREQLVQARLLKPVADSVEMGRILGSNFAPVGPDGFTLASGMTLAPDAAQDIAAEAIVKQDLIFRRIRTQSRKLIERRSNDLAEAIGRIPESAIAQNKADLYRQLSDRLVQDYRQYLTDQAMTMKQAGYDPQTQREIAAATSRVTEFYRGIANAVSNGLRAIAAEIPDAALADVNATRAWIEQRLNDPNQPRLMSDEARDWLLNPIGRFTAPIRRDPRLHKRLGAIREIAEGKKEALDRMLAFQRAMNKLGKKVPPQQFATKFAKLRDQYRKEAEAVKEITWEIERAEGDVNGAEAAAEFMDRLLADPDYQARVSEAVNGLQVRSTVREYEVTSAGYTGRVKYINPLTQKPVFIDLQPDITSEKKNIQEVAKLRDDVTEWMASNDDPVARNAWQREVEWLERYALIVSGGLTTGTFALGYRIPSAFSIGSGLLSRDLWRGRLELRGPAYQRIGNRVVLPAHQAAIIAGQVDREIRKITDDFEKLISGSAQKASIAHGRDGSAQDIVQWYEPNVLEPIVSQFQNPTATPYKVGDWIAPGIQVLKEDMVAAKALKKRNDALFDFLQKMEKDTPFGLLFYDPLQITEKFAGRILSRYATNYGLKMPRRPLSRQNERGRTFVSDWMNSTDGNARLEMLRQSFDWVLMSNGLIGNTDSEFNPTLEDRDKKFFAEIRQKIRSNNAPQTLSELVQQAGDAMATDEIDSSTAAAEFQIRLMKYVDTFVHNFNRAMDIVEVNTKDELTKLNIPSGIIDSVGVGKNPFLTPRGRLVAPPSFYKNTALDSTSWGGLTAGVRSVMTLRELEAISAAEAAINKELERFENRLNGEIPTLQRQLKAQKAVRVGPFSAKRRIARSSRKRADAGELMYDYLTLKDHRRAIIALRADLERLAREHVLLPEDNPAIQAVRNVRQGMSSALLQSIISIANNTFGGAVANMLTRRSLGLWNFITTPVEMLWEGSRYAADAAISRMLKYPGVDQFTQKLAKTPGFRRLIRILVAEQLRHDQQKAFAEYARTVEPQSPAERAAVAKMFPQTYGRLTDEEVGPIAAMFNLFMTKVPGVARAAEISKTMFPGAIDRLLNQVTTNRIETWANQIEKAGLEAWQARDTGVEGWDDLANPLNRFVAKDLRLPNETALAMWRNLLFPVGSLEAITLDHYKRLKAGNESQMLNPGQLSQVAQEFLKKTNMADSSATPTMFQGRGWSGEIRKSIFMLMRYMTNFSSVQENIAGRVYGDTSKAAVMWRVQSSVIVALLALMLLSFGKELGQEARQVITRDPRTAQPITALMEDPSVEDFGRYVGTSMASILPFIGERVAQAFGGTSNRPLLDTTKMIAPLGLLADVEQAIKRTYQTGDAAYPLADLIRRYIPLSSAAINRMLPGETETREASRALRLAAPTDIEIRESGSSTAARQTANTPIMRTAIRKAMAGDQEGAKEALDQAVRLRVEAGQTEADARSAVAAAFQARDPERTTFGRMLTAEERRRTLARMTGRQRNSYLRSRRVFDSQLFGSSRRRRRISARRRRASLARRGARASRPRSL